MKWISVFSVLLIILLSGCQKKDIDSYLLKFYGDALQDIGYSVAIASDGYLVAGQRDMISRKDGYMSDTSNKNLSIIKTDWNGNIRWQINEGGRFDDQGVRLYQLQDGSSVCVGTLTDTVNAPYLKQVFAVKVSSNGSVLWKKSYGGSGNQKGKDIIPAGEGYIILGSTDAGYLTGADSTGNIQGNTDLLIIKISSTGELIDSHPAGFPGNEIPASIRQDVDGKLIVLATTDRSIQGTDMKLNNLYILKLTTNGENGPNNVIGTAEDEYAGNFEITDKGYLIAGTIVKNNGENAYMVRIPRDIFSGTVERNYFQIDNKPTYVNAITSYSGGNFLLAGYVDANPGLRMAICETDSDGSLVAGKFIVNGSTGDQVANDVTAGDDGYIVAVGSNTYQVNSMITLLKFKF